MLKPGQTLENTIRIINEAFHYSSIPYWLCFGGLWALIKNEGVIPDGDLTFALTMELITKRLLRL
jgi:hypothetical protein